MYRILLLLYSFAYCLLLLVSLPVIYIRRLRTGKRAHIQERLGWKLNSVQFSDKDVPTVWIHAVSVGEVKAIRSLAAHLQEKGVHLLITTTTQTGQQLARHFFSHNAPVVYFPLDLSYVCRRFIRFFSPDLIILTETEFWPNFIDAAWRARIPVVVVNGRISDRSFPRYRRASWLVRPVLERIAHFYMQSRQDKERILALGVPPEKVNWVGNLKFDYHLDQDEDGRRVQKLLLSRLNGTENDLVWLCGSTRDGEEELLLPIYVRLKRKYPSLKWVLVPRHPHRCEAVGQLLEEAKISWSRRSAIMPPKQRNGAASVDCIIVDTIGELPYLYPIADIVYIGGSLVPTGGQNPIEPAAFAKPVIFGPHMENFREIADIFVKSYAALQVGSTEELYQRLEALIQDSTTRSWLGRNARKVIRSNQGALARTAQIVLGHLPGNPPRDAQNSFSTL